jgi:hypothetical protein
LRPFPRCETVALEPDEGSLVEPGIARRSNDWVGPATGIVFVVLLAITLILAGEGVDPKDGAEEVLSYYSDNEDEVRISGFLGGLAVVFFLFFAGWLRRLLREAEGPGGWLSAVSFAGGIVFAVAGGVASTLKIAYNYFIPFAVGFSTFLLAAGISAVRHGALPGWLGWSAIVLGVATYTPAGFFAFLLGLVWVLAASLVLLPMRARAG